MFASLISRVELLAQDAARNAGVAFFLLALLVGAILFVSAGAAFALSHLMPPALALMLVGSLLGGLAIASMVVVRRDQKHATAQPRTDARSVVDTLVSAAPAIDLMTADALTLRFRRAPLATLAATVMVGAAIGLLSSRPKEQEFD